ncbi:MAG: Tat pathway signal protein [Burkholderiales bacterium PBB5]|nr:MAG: Tat pathway signal protein [Burkholderiales bacterium PBB5]
MNASRRQFLRAGSGLMAAAANPLAAPLNAPLALSLAGLGAMAAQSASAADTSGYKALVCLFMAGGSDQHNWVVPIDASGYAAYAKVRQELAWPAAKLLPITSTTQGSGRAFGMPLELQPLQALYEAGHCAVVANVGPLERPLTKTEYQNGVGTPAKLFSHNDQQSTWQSLSPEGARSGWGGRMGDVLAAANAYPVFTAVSAAGNAVFLTGSTVTQYQVGASGPLAMQGLGASWLHGSTTAGSALAKVLKTSGNDLYQAEYSRVVQRSIDTTSTLTSALQASPVAALPTAPITLPSGATLTLANDGLAKQLRMVAQMIAAAPKLGMRRQVFMVQVGGFDSHNYQMRDQPLLMARVAQSVAWFYNALTAVGQGNNVTLFTASDFGRTLVSNGDGSDHGWGSHHLVVGGAVKGRTIYGNFPVAALGSADDIGSGRLLPSTSVTQLASSLGGWMGLSAAERLTVLPTLGNFSAGPALF